MTDTCKPLYRRIGRCFGCRAYAKFDQDRPYPACDRNSAEAMGYRPMENVEFALRQ